MVSNLRIATLTMFVRVDSGDALIHHVQVSAVLPHWPGNVKSKTDI